MFFVLVFCFLCMCFPVFRSSHFPFILFVLLIFRFSLHSCVSVFSMFPFSSRFYFFIFLFMLIFHENVQTLCCAICGPNERPLSVHLGVWVHIHKSFGPFIFPFSLVRLYPPPIRRVNGFDCKSSEIFFELLKKIRRKRTDFATGSAAQQQGHTATNHGRSGQSEAIPFQVRAAL